MSTRDVGKYLEDFVVEMLGAKRRTKNSGANDEVGDILHPNYYMELKKRNTKTITIDPKVWRKLCNQIPVGSLKIPLYILQNVDKETFVVLSLKDFAFINNKLKE